METRYNPCILINSKIQIENTIKKQKIFAPSKALYFLNDKEEKNEVCILMQLIHTNVITW